MRGKSLNFKLMITFVGVILFFAVISYSLLIKSFQQYYQEDIYKVLEDNNDKKIDREYSDIDEILASNEDIRNIEQLTFRKVGKRLKREPFNTGNEGVSDEVITEIEENILGQRASSKRYDMVINGRRLFYVVDIYTAEDILRDRIKILDKTKAVEQISRFLATKKRQSEVDITYYIVSLRWEPLDNTLEDQLYIQLGIVLVVTTITAFVIFFVLSRYLTRPLNQLTKSVKRISNRKFDVPIAIERQDEIGFLAGTIEEMRKDLLSYDEEQKLKLHSISHELKTPIMIIQSYVDALQRGMHPKGTPEASLEVIGEECDRLQKLVANLLYIQRLDYMDTEIKNRSVIDVSDAVNDVVNNMAITLGDINLIMEVDHGYIQADYNQVKVILENLMSNQIRYAKKDIRVSLQQNQHHVTLEIFNDGEPIDQPDEIFKMFKKGKKGQSGLGLYIVNRLVRISGGTIHAINKPIGVSFIVQWPIQSGKGEKTALLE